MRLTGRVRPHHVQTPFKASGGVEVLEAMQRSIGCSYTLNIHVISLSGKTPLNLSTALRFRESGFLADEPCFLFACFSRGSAAHDTRKCRRKMGFFWALYIYIYSRA